MTKDIEREAFETLPEVEKLYQACKERDLTIAERGYLKGARDAWQAAKAQAVPDGFVVVPKEPTDAMYQAYARHSVAPMSTLSKTGYKAMLEAARGGNE